MVTKEGLVSFGKLIPFTASSNNFAPALEVVPSLNSTVILEKLSALVEVIALISCTLLIADSMGSVISFSTSPLSLTK